MKTINLHDELKKEGWTHICRVASQDHEWEKLVLFKAYPLKNEYGVWEWTPSDPESSEQELNYNLFKDSVKSEDGPILL